MFALFLGDCPFKCIVAIHWPELVIDIKPVIRGRPYRTNIHLCSSRARLDLSNICANVRLSSPGLRDRVSCPDHERGESPVQERERERVLSGRSCGSFHHYVQCRCNNNIFFFRYCSNKHDEPRSIRNRVVLKLT